MEYLETSRSARKFDPSRTARYRRADPKSSNIVLGYDREQWETTNNKIQREVVRGLQAQGHVIKGERKLTNKRKQGMLETTLSLGSAVNDWRTESKRHYRAHDLKSWGPRTLVQTDSYSWTERDRNNLQNLRDSRYLKLPPIYSRSPTQAHGDWNDVNGNKNGRDFISNEDWGDIASNKSARDVIHNGRDVTNSSVATRRQQRGKRYKSLPTDEDDI